MHNITTTLQTLQLVLDKRGNGGMEGVKIGQKNITDQRYADDAVLLADRIGKMQRMMDSLSETCNVYGMEISVKKTKVLIVGDT